MVELREGIRSAMFAVVESSLHMVGLVKICGRSKMSEALDYS